MNNRQTYEYIQEEYQEFIKTRMTRKYVRSVALFRERKCCALFLTPRDIKETKQHLTIMFILRVALHLMYKECNFQTAITLDSEDVKLI